MNKNTLNFKRHYRNFIPPYCSWDDELVYNKESSAYYQIIASKLGTRKANFIWKSRDDEEFYNMKQKDCHKINKKIDRYLLEKGCNPRDYNLFRNKDRELEWHEEFVAI